jgi:hypothetical protein
LQLKVNVSGALTNSVVPPLDPGQTYLFQTPVSADQLANAGGITFRSQLINPSGLVDQQPANNAKAGVIIPPVK